MDYLKAPEVVTGLVFIGLVASPTIRRLGERLIKHMMPTLALEVSTLRVREMARRLRGLDVLEMNSHERVIAGDIIDCRHIREEFSSIGGLSGTVEDLRWAVIYPLTRPELRLGLNLNHAKRLDDSVTRSQLCFKCLRSTCQKHKLQTKQDTTSYSKAAYMRDNMQEVLTDPAVTLDLSDIARKTEAYSGSGLRDLCTDAGKYPAKEYVLWESSTDRSADPRLSDNPLRDNQVNALHQKAGRALVGGRRTSNLPSSTQVSLSDLIVLTRALAIWMAIRAIVRFLLEQLVKHYLAAPAQEMAADDVHERASRRRLLDVVLNEYEQIIAQGIIDYEDVKEDFTSIGGLDGTIKRIKEAITLPLERPELGLSPSRGVLLYGPPGTGKTHLAKAVAKEAEATFINLDMKDILSKFQGESQRLVFSLAKKVQPAIIFVDEVDSLLSARHNGDNDLLDNLKSYILGLWEGITTDGKSLVTILAATNHKVKLDKAALRRFDSQLEVPLPRKDQRESILEVVLGAARMPDNMQERLEDQDVQLNLKDLAKRTEGYSGSDLRNMCKDARKFPVRDYLDWECGIRQQENHWYKDNPLLEKQVTLRKPQQSDYESAIRERNCPNNRGADTLSNSFSSSSVMLLPSPPLSRKTTQSGIDKVGGKRKSPGICNNVINPRSSTTIHSCVQVSKVSPPLVATKKKVRIL
eukprot:SM000081S22623  [mRNA]  locus=s81:138622:150959:- [translate_table: standard]